MILIFGGAYQGKLDYVKEHYNISESQIFRCEKSMVLDFSADVLYNLQDFIFACVCEGLDAVKILAAHQQELQDKIIIVDDISQGIVPMDADQRAWREMTGRTMLWLGKEASVVVRVFCGLGHKIKFEGKYEEIKR